MRLGRKLSEGFAVDNEADASAPAPVAEGVLAAEGTVPVAIEPDRVAGPGAPVASGQPPVG